MTDQIYQFLQDEWYPPMIVVKVQYFWVTKRYWEVVLPTKQYGIAQKVRLGFRSHKNDYNGNLQYSIKRALRAKAMVKAYNNLDAYIQLPDSRTDFVKLTDETAIEYILLYGS